MIYLIHGEDSFSSHEFLQELIETIGSEEVRDSNLTYLGPSEFTVNALGSGCMVAPFLANRRMTIITGTLSSEENRSRARRVKERKNPIPQGLEDLLKQIPPFSDVVFFEEKIALKSELYSLIEDLSKDTQTVSIREFKPLRKEFLSQWIVNRCSSLGVQIATDATQALVDRIGSNLWILNSEISKLSIYVGNQNTISVGAVNELVTRVREANVFELVDALIERRYAQALKTTQQLLNDGQSGSYLLSMITSQARKIAIAQELIEKRVSTNEWGSRIGTQSDFVIRKTENQAKKFSKNSIALFFSLLLKTDIAIKSSNNDEIALTELIAESSSLPRN